MATKLDTEQKLFVGPTAVREGSVQDVVRKAVSELGGAPGGEGVSYADLEKHLLANFTPKKSQGYGASYVKAYVRDAVNRYGYLSHTDGGHDYSAIAAPEKKAPAPKKLTKAQQGEIDALNFIRTKGEVSDAGDLDSTQITVQDFVTETNKKQKTVEKMVDSLETQGFVRKEQREDSTYVFLTSAGFSRLQEIDSADTGEATEATGADAEA